MKALYVREITVEETDELKKGLQSNSAFTVRRSQILLNSRQGMKASAIAERLHCSDETVRATIHAFHEEGVGCLKEKSHSPECDLQL